MLATTAMAQRTQQTINDAWQMDGQSVHLPHSWNADAYQTADYQQGTHSYVRTLNIPASWTNRSIYLKFEGANKTAVVSIDGREVGKHHGGYTAFTFDITPYVKPGASHKVQVSVDNADATVAPISADFTFFGGIYRDVWLVSTPQQHFAMNDMGGDGMYVSTPQVSAEQGTVSVRGRLRNDAAQASQLEVVSRLLAPSGQLVQSVKQTVKIATQADVEFTQQFAAVPRPQLWSPESPALYTVESVLRDKKSGAELDRISHHVAFRWFAFDGAKGFMLNGEPYKLHGICRHQDQAPYGYALSDEMHRRDMQLAKEMGANFIRIAHYPQDEAILEQCDKLGLLAWEEIPVIDVLPDSKEYAEHAEQNLREMIRQHYNHPSVILWGFMNEILLRANTADEALMNRTVALARHLANVVKEEDPTRLSTIAFHGSEAYNTVGLSELTDVVGWNLYQGWYGSNLADFDAYMADQHKRFPNHSMIVSEYGAGSDRRLHTLSPVAFDFSMEYQQKYIEHYLPVIEQTPYITGATYWNLIDFGSAKRQESMPHINNKGLLYNNREPKDVYYYFQAMWRKDIPVLHIAARDGGDRRALVVDGNGKATMPIKVYTNGSSVELFVDGVSVGRQAVNNCNAVFQVSLTGGNHTLQAKGDKGATDEMLMHFNAVPAKLDNASLEHFELAINVGAHCEYHAPDSQLAWVADRPYTAGSWGYVGGEDYQSQNEVKLAADVPLMQTQRRGIEAYRFDVPEGCYELELSWADLSATQPGTAYLLGRSGGESAVAGSFALLVNGQMVETALTPADLVGPTARLCRKYVVNVAGTEGLRVDFKGIQGKTFLNAIKLRKLY